MKWPDGLRAEDSTWLNKLEKAAEKDNDKRRLLEYFLKVARARSINGLEKLEGVILQYKGKPVTESKINALYHEVFRVAYIELEGGNEKYSDDDDQESDGEMEETVPELTGKAGKKAWKKQKELDKEEEAEAAASKYINKHKAGTSVSAQLKKGVTGKRQRKQTDVYTDNGSDEEDVPEDVDPGPRQQQHYKPSASKAAAALADLMKKRQAKANKPAPAPPEEPVAAPKSKVCGPGKETKYYKSGKKMGQPYCRKTIRRATKKQLLEHIRHEFGGRLPRIPGGLTKLTRDELEKWTKSKTRGMVRAMRRKVFGTTEKQEKREYLRVKKLTKRKF